MTFKDMIEILNRHGISSEVKVYGNSGWECGATSVEAIWYSATKNEIHLVQGVNAIDYLYDEDSLKSDKEKAHDWVRLS